MTTKDRGTKDTADELKEAAEEEEEEARRGERREERRSSTEDAKGEKNGGRGQGTGVVLSLPIEMDRLKEVNNTNSIRKRVRTRRTKGKERGMRIRGKDEGQEE